MCGHSLGPMPKRSADSVNRCLENWSHDAITAWNKADWINLPNKLGELIAPLIGANANEVVVTDSTSINLFKTLHSALALNPKRHILATEQNNFPADLYIVQGIEHFNKNLTLHYLPSDQIINQLTEDIAVLTLTHVNYRTSQIQDMGAITQRAHELGIIVVWDLSHSIGTLPLTLNQHNVDFAVGCSYKYLNGGPGSPSFIYANKKHHQHISNPIYGWMGQESPFAFSKEFQPSSGTNAFLGGTPSILSMKSLEGALELFSEFSIIELRKKNIENSTYLIDLLSEKAPSLSLLSPKSPNHRGGHVAFQHSQAYPLSRALIDQGLICDYREPNLLRLSTPPLYIDQSDIENASSIIEKTLRNLLYEQPQFQQPQRVT